MKKRHILSKSTPKKVLPRVATALASRSLSDRRNSSGSSLATGGWSEKVAALTAAPRARNWVFALDNGSTTYLQLNAEPKKVRDALSIRNETMKSATSVHQAVYAALYELVSKMPALPEGHVLAAAPDSAAYAAELLTEMSQYSGVAPKVFAHGGDAVVLTWDSDDHTRYLTIVGDDTNFQEVRKSTKEVIDEDVSFQSPNDRHKWLTILGGVPISQSNLNDVD